MKIFSFPFAIESDDFGNYLLDADTLGDTVKLVESAKDHFGIDIEDDTVKDIKADDTPIYEALSLTKYPSLGYKTREELLSAYDKLIAGATVQAYSMDNLEPAVVGITEDLKRFVYDYDLIIQTLMDDETDEESAIEWYEYNIVRSFPYYQPSPIVMQYVGE